MGFCYKINIKVQNILIFTAMVSPLAYIDPQAKIGENVTIHP